MKRDEREGNEEKEEDRGNRDTRGRGEKEVKSGKR
jgi:hypothetical protein